MACWCARRSYDLISLPGLLNVLGLLVFLLCCFLLDCLYWKVGCIRRCLLGRLGMVSHAEALGVGGHVYIQVAHVPRLVQNITCWLADMLVGFAVC